MKLKQIKNGEETVIMEAPHEDALKAKAREVQGYPEPAIWKRSGGSESDDEQDVAAAQSQAQELNLEDGSLLRISLD